jgi:transmembrane sensor
MKTDLFIEIIVKQLSGESSPEENATLNNWLNQSEENRQTYSTYKRLWDKTELENDFSPDVDKAYQKFLDAIQNKENKVIEFKPYTKKTPWKSILSIAASLLFLVSISVYIRFNMADKIITVSTVQKENKAFSLPDGSTVYLNKNSKLDYASKFNQRAIKFEGEAFFEIKRDVSKPFTIACKNSFVKVLGTSFNVNSIENTSKVVVIVKTGKVQISSSKSNQTAILEPGDKGIIHVATGDIEKLKNEHLNYNSWRDDKLSFENERLEILCQELSKYFNISIEVSKEIKDCRFTTTFNKPKLEDVLALFGNYYNIHKSNNGKQILITGTKCD